MVTFTERQGNFVIMVGGPASGKDFVVNNLIDIQAKEINPDHTLERIAAINNINLADASQVYGLHLHLKPKLDKFFNTFIRQQRKTLANVVLNKTGSDYAQVQSLISILKNLGYQVTVVYVQTTLKTALSRNITRNRRVPSEVVIKKWTDARDTYRKLLKLADHAWVVDNEAPWTVMGIDGKYERDSTRITKIK